MENFAFNSLLCLHVTGGAIGLLTGSIILVVRKGDKIHKLFGRIFSFGMHCTGITSLVLSILNPNYFLFIVGIFTLFLVTTGNRYIQRKSDKNISMFDYVISYIMLLAALIFLVWGIIKLFRFDYFGIVLIVFSVIALGFVRTDLRNYKGDARVPNFWLLAHLQRMTGCYIASLTAFLVVNSKHFTFIPNIVLWLLPTMMLVPLIFKWSRRYAIKTVEPASKY